MHLYRILLVVCPSYVKYYFHITQSMHPMEYCIAPKTMTLAAPIKIISKTKPYMMISTKTIAIFKIITSVSPLLIRTVYPCST